MKSKFILLLIVVGFIFTSCDIKNPTEGLEVRIETLTRTTGVNVQLLDANTAQPITKTVNVKFVGSNNESIISSSNDPITELNTTAGIAVFSLKDDITPSKSNPFSISLVISSDGFAETSKKITIDKSGVSNFTIQLTNLAQPPQGVASNSDNSGQASGSNGTNQDVAVSSATGNDNNSGGEAVVVVPSGTVLTDNSGTPLTGSMQTTVVYTNTTQNSALNTLPGGANAGAVDENNNPVNGDFVPAGAVTVDLSVNGQNVNGVGGSGINLSTTIPNDAVNPTTGQAYQEGESIGVWVYNPELSVWEWIKDLVVSTDSSASKATRFLSSGHKFHINFSIFSPGIFSFGNVLKNVSSCEKTLVLESTTGASGAVYLDVSAQDGTLLGAVAPLFTAAFSNVTFMNGTEFDVTAPENLPSIKIEVYDKPLSNNSKNKIGELSITDFCSLGDRTVISYTPQVTPINVTIAVSVKCDSKSDNPRVISPNGFSLWARQVSQDGSQTLGDWEYIGAFSGGKVTGALIENKYYEFKTEYDGEFYYSLDYEPPFAATSSGISYSVVDDNRVCDNF